VAGLELAREIGHRLEPLRVLLRHGPLDRPIQPRRHIGPNLADAGYRLVHVLHCDGDEGVALERNLAREQLVEHAPEGIDVGLFVDRLPAGLLRRDVVARAHDRPGDRHPVDVDCMGDAEISDLRPPVAVEEDVLRLDVAVDEALVVREGEPARDLQRQLDRLANRQRPFAVDELLQVLSIDVLEDDELATVLLTAVDHRDDIGMRQLGDRPGLAPEALDVVLVTRELLMEDLQCDAALEQAVVRAIDARHAA